MQVRCSMNQFNELVLSFCFASLLAVEKKALSCLTRTRVSHLRPVHKTHMTQSLHRPFDSQRLMAVNRTSIEVAYAGRTARRLP